MSRAIKLKNNDYLDASGVVYNRTTIDSILNTLTNNIDNTFMYRGAETATTTGGNDFNSLIEVGFYHISWAGRFSNCPNVIAGSWGILLTYIAGDYRMQQYKDFNSQTLFTRTYNDGAWNSWR